MRIERIITAVTSTLVISTVRQMQAVGLFVRTVNVQLGDLRMHFGMSARERQMHAGFLRWPSLMDLAAAIDAGAAESKRGCLLYQPLLVPATGMANRLASCPANRRGRFSQV